MFGTCHNGKSLYGCCARLCYSCCSPTNLKDEIALTIINVSDRKQIQRAIEMNSMQREKSDKNDPDFSMVSDRAPSGIIVLNEVASNTNTNTTSSTLPQNSQTMEISTPSINAGDVPRATLTYSNL